MTHHLDHKSALVTGRSARDGVSASVMRCSAESDPIELSVPNMSLSIEPTRPPTARNPYSSLAEGPRRPSFASSSTNEPHSSRRTCAPVKLPSPPITISRFIPWRSRLYTASFRPSRSRKPGASGRPQQGSTLLQHAPNRVPVKGPNQAAALDHPLKPFEIPYTSALRSNAARTAERTAAFMPCASPPLVRTPRRTVFVMCRPPSAAKRLPCATPQWRHRFPTDYSM